MYSFKIISLHVFAFILAFLSTVDKVDASKSEPKECEDWICLNKCCPESSIYRNTLKGTECTKPSTDKVKDAMNYTKIKTPRGTSRTKTKTQDCLLNEEAHCIELIDNSHQFRSNTTRVAYYPCEFIILQNGMLESQEEICPHMPKNKYCVDFIFVGGKNPLKLFYLALSDDTTEPKRKDTMSAVGMSISAFFILLILLVYGLLPKLQNIVGMVLMAYLLTFMVALILRVVQIKARLNPKECSSTGPAAYFFLLASFFWLNIMAFDIWWTIRGSRKCRSIHRRGEIVKFLWYTVYAWGTPLALTLVVVAVDQWELYTKKMFKPPFAGCFSDAKSTYLYIGAPMGTLIFVNLILFLLSARELWLINKALGSPDSNNTKNNKRFVLYIKLFLIMGVSWLLELVPNEIPTALYIFVNLWNVLIGVILFIIFVCKKSVFIMLCNRFNIHNYYVDNLKSSQYSRSKTLSSSMGGKGTNKKYDDGRSEGTTMENETLGNIYPDIEVMK